MKPVRILIDSTNPKNNFLAYFGPPEKIEKILSEIEQKLKDPVEFIDITTGYDDETRRFISTLMSRTTADPSDVERFTEQRRENDPHFKIHIFNTAQHEIH